MRILGFSVDWPKLRQQRFTTFRFSRRDRDWEKGEVVQVVLHPRSKGRQLLGTAEIVSKEPRMLVEPGWTLSISEEEAVADGFLNYADMLLWMGKQHGNRVFQEPINKLTLKWRGRRVK